MGLALESLGARMKHGNTSCITLKTHQVHINGQVKIYTEKFCTNTLTAHFMCYGYYGFIKVMFVISFIEVIL